MDDKKKKDMNEAQDQGKKGGMSQQTNTSTEDSSMTNEETPEMGDVEESEMESDQR